VNINYHYYTVKTLAVHAGFTGETAQYIAYFSQHIDDFIMHSPFTLDSEPPDFFIKNRLACRLGRNRWAFLPCTTGINMLRTFSSGYRLTTLMPFHFIMSQPYNRLHKNAERSLFRCVTANQGRDLLINRLADDLPPGDWMAMGMYLHTFADTFAHEGFSGFQGWENAAFVHEGMDRGEALFHRALPSIGHANAGSAPDECGLAIDIFAKRTERGAFESFIRRDNTTYFADCSRRILDILCAANKKTPFDNRQWNALQAKLAQAQNSEGKQDRQASWEEVFPEIAYSYQRDEFVQIQLELLRHDSNVTSRLRLRAHDLHDVYSEESDRGRLAAITLGQNVNDDFFRYNETAYRHVHKATGDFTTHSNRTQLAAYCNMAGSS